MRLPSTTLSWEASCRPSMDLSSAKLSSTLPSSCREKQVRWQVSSLSISTWWISWTISWGETWRRGEATHKPLDTEESREDWDLEWMLCVDTKWLMLGGEAIPGGQRALYQGLGFWQWSLCPGSQSLPVRWTPPHPPRPHPVWTPPPLCACVSRRRSSLLCLCCALIGREKIRVDLKNSFESHSPQYFIFQANMSYRCSFQIFWLYKYLVTSY